MIDRIRDENTCERCERKFDLIERCSRNDRYYHIRQLITSVARRNDDADVPSST